MEDEFPKSVVLHFPLSVYQRTGAGEMLPKLLQILKPEDLRCVQFLRGGKVRVSFCEQAVRDHLLSEGMCLDGMEIPVTKDAEEVTVLYVRDLPYEVSDEDVIDFFSTFGEVLIVERSVVAETPNLFNGNRVLKMVLKDSLPYFVSVCGYQCRVWYRGQPIQCFICRQSGHRAQACPLSGWCRYCHQAGHMAKDCAQAWVPPPSVAPVDSSFYVDRAPETEPDLPDKSLVDDVPMPPPDPVPDDVPVSKPAQPAALSPADPVPDDVSRSGHSFLTAKAFCARFSKIYVLSPFPNFSETGKEWASKAKAYLRLKIKTVFNDKEIALTNSDFRRWTENDLRAVSNLFCETLAVPDSLIDFVFGLVKSFWNNSKK